MTRDEISKAGDAELNSHLGALGVSDHYYEYNTHHHSHRLRQMARDTPVMIEEHGHKYELYADLASTLDSFHQRRKHGRIAVYTTEQKRKMLMDLIDGKARVAGKKIVRV